MTRGSTNIGVRIAAPSGGTTNYALQLSDTGGTAAGGITFGTDTTLYRSAADTLKTDDAVIITPTGNPLVALTVSPTISHASANARAINSMPIFTGAGTSPGGAAFQPEFQPSANISVCYGFINIAKGNPDTGVTITNMHSAANRIDTGSLAGAISNAQGMTILTSTLGTIIPTSMRGINVQSVYPSATSAGTTNVMGIQIDTQKGGTSLTEGLRVQYSIAGTGIGAVSTTAAIDVVGGGYLLGDQTATITNQYGLVINQPTYTSTTNIRTVTNSIGLMITGAAIASTNVTMTNGPFSAQISGATTLSNIAGSITRAINVPSYTLTLANTTQITSVGPSAVGIGQVTIAQTGGAVIVNNASSLYISAAPTAGASVTLTNAYSIWVDDGASRFDANIHMPVANTGLFFDAVGTFSYGISKPTAGASVEIRHGSSLIKTVFDNAGDITLYDSGDLILGTTTGTKIATATTQKLGFWNATPIVQPTTAGAASTFAANTSLIANDTATFDGYTIGQVVKALRDAGLLA